MSFSDFNVSNAAGAVKSAGPDEPVATFNFVNIRHSSWRCSADPEQIDASLCGGPMGDTV